MHQHVCCHQACDKAAIDALQLLAVVRLVLLARLSSGTNCTFECNTGFKKGTGTVAPRCMNGIFEAWDYLVSRPKDWSQRHGIGLAVAKDAAESANAKCSQECLFFQQGRGCGKCFLVGNFCWWEDPREGQQTLPMLYRPTCQGLHFDIASPSLDYGPAGRAMFA